jgi:hypothetical protein
VIPSARSARFVGLLAFSGLFATLVACSGSAPEAPAEQAQPGAKARKAKAPGAGEGRPDAVHVVPKRFGNLTSDTAPTVEGIAAKMGAPYTARAAEGALAGATVQILRDGAVVADVWPSADGKSILRAYSTSDKVQYPFNGRVGLRMGDHKNWTRMVCEAAPSPLDGKAFCHASSDAHLGYIVEGWAGDATVVPAKEALADLKIVGLLWAPAAPGEVTKPAVAPLPADGADKVPADGAQE